MRYLPPALAALALAAGAQSSIHYLSFDAPASVPGAGEVRDEDVLAYDPQRGLGSLYFDGSDVGLEGADVDAVHVRPDGALVLSLRNASFDVPGLTGGPDGATVDDADLLLFTFTSSGPDTAGAFSFLFDGSDVGLEAGGEDVDAVFELPGGELLLSLSGAGDVPGLGAVDDEDVLRFTPDDPAAPGSATAGSWSLHFDGGAAGFGDAAGEDLDAVSVDSPAGDLLFSTSGKWQAAGASGADEDVGRFSGTLGAAPAGTASLVLDLSQLGIDPSEDVDGYSFAAPQPPPPPPAMEIAACSLGCSGVPGSPLMTCGATEIAPNEVIAVEFTEPVDLATVGVRSFRITDPATGEPAQGSYLLDPADPRRLLFRPLIGFGPAGEPQFGFEAGATYEVLVPAQPFDPPPWVTSTGGAPNQTRLLCAVSATADLVDTVPGPPQVQVLVDVVLAYDAGGQPSVIVPDVPANGATGVFRDTQVTFVFGDLMDVGSLFDPASGQSDGVVLSVDADGDLADPSDQIQLCGSFVA